MKKFLLILLVASFTSCEQIEKIDKQMDADSTDIANEISDLTGTLQAVEKLSKEENTEMLFKASGSEPGWFAEFYTDKFRMILNYGKDSIILYKKFSKNDYGFSHETNDNGKEIKLTVKVEDKECVSASGDKKSKTVIVNFRDKTYIGCGEEK